MKQVGNRSPLQAVEKEQCPLGIGVILTPGTGLF